MADNTEIILAEGIRDNLIKVEKDIRNLKDKLPILNEQRRVLLSILDSAIEATISSDNDNRQLQAPTNAIINFVTKYPGATTAKIANDLKDLIDSQSPNKKQIIYTVLSQLRKSGKIRMDDDKRHHIATDVRI